MTIAPLLLCAISFWQKPIDLSTKITFSQPAMTLGRLLPKLGEAAGVKMEADKSIKNEVVLIRVKAMSVKDLMARVAAVSTGKWAEEDGKRILYLDKNTANKQAQADIDKVVKSIDAWCEQAIMSSQNSRSNNEGMTSSKFGAQLAKLIPLQTLAMIEGGQTQDYAIPANPSQVALPQEAWDLSQVYLSSKTPKISGPLAKVLVHVLCTGPASYQLEINLARQDGKRLDQIDCNIWSMRQTKTVLPIVLSQPEAKIILDHNLNLLRKAAAPAINAAAYRQGSSFMVTLNGTMGVFGSFSLNSTQFKPQGEETRKVVLDPVANEPLNLYLGESVVGLADSQGWDLVACLPDFALKEIAGQVREGMSASEYANSLSKAESLSAIAEKGMLLVSPSNPCFARAKRLDRKSLKSLLARADSSRITIDDWADYFSSQPTVDPLDTFEAAWLSMIDLSKVADLYATNREAYRFLGLLGKGLRGQLRAGAKVPVSSIPFIAKQSLARCLDRFVKTCNWTTPPTAQNRDEIYVGDINMYVTELVKDFNRWNATLSIEQTERQCYFGIPEYGRSMALDHIAIPRVPTCTTFIDGRRDVGHPRIRYPNYALGRRSVQALSVSLGVDPRIYTYFTSVFPFTQDELPSNPKLLKLVDTAREFQDWIQQNEAQFESDISPGTKGVLRP